MTGSMQKVRAGALGYHAGRAAEEIVAQDYDGRGQTVVHRRWRSSQGEIDLIARDGERVIFVEVKKSRSFSAAAQRLNRRQMDRLYAAASLFLAQEPHGQLTEVRFDVAMVDASGAVRILENAFAEA